MGYGKAKANWNDKKHIRLQRADVARLKTYDAEDEDDTFDDDDDSEDSADSSLIDPTQMVLTGNPINLDKNPFTRF